MPPTGEPAEEAVPGSVPESATAAGSKRDASSAAGSPDSGAATAKKAKKNGPGSRGVANLTPEQLAKKRANDREAQRAIRERTKNQIEALEARILDLTSQQPYQELQAVVRQKEAVEEENKQIKQQLASIVGMLQPLIGNAYGQTPVSHAYGQPPPPSTALRYPRNDAPTPDGGRQPTDRPIPEHHYSTQQPAPSASAQNAATPSSTASPGSIEHPSAPTGWHGGFAPSHPPRRHRQHRDGSKPPQEMPEKLGLGFLIDSDQVTRIPSGAYGAQDTPHYQNHNTHSGPKSNGDTAYEHNTGRPSTSDSSSNWHSQQQQVSPSWRTEHMPYHHAQSTSPSDPQHARQAPSVAAVTSSSSTPYYAVPVVNCEPTCPLDHILLNFLNHRRRLAAEGHPLTSVIGPAYPSVSSLLNPASSTPNSHPLSKIFTDMMRTFPDLRQNLPETIAVVFIMFLVMRWQVDPTEDNYKRLPSWMQPSESQRRVPHPAWIDHLPFPEMRDRLIRIFDPSSPSPQGLQHYHFENFFVPFTQTLHLSWPYMAELAVMTDGVETVINPVFETHLRDLRNWKLGPAFTAKYPGLADTIMWNTHNLPSVGESEAEGSTREWAKED